MKRSQVAYLSPEELAIQCAAELWGVPWQEVVHGARVMWAPPET